MSEEPVDVVRLRSEAERAPHDPIMDGAVPLHIRLARIEEKVDAISRALLEMGKALIARGSL